MARSPRPTRRWLLGEKHRTARDGLDLGFCGTLSSRHDTKSLNSPSALSVFISHAAGDGVEPAVRLDQSLRQQGMATWLCYRDLNQSLDFTAGLERAISTADILIACITADVLRDDSFVRREILYAQGCRKPIAVARFAPVLPPISVVANTYFEFYRDWDTAFGQLLRFCQSARQR